MSAALEYHRATNVAADGTDEEDARDIARRPPPFHDYGDAARLPLETSVAGRVLQDGAGIVRSQQRRDYGGGTIHWRAYSSAGALYPVEAYVAAADGLYSFDPLSRALVPIAAGDTRAAVAAAAAIEPEADAFIVLTGLHARTGWKYGERGYRHVWWDAGTLLANLLALAAADELSPTLYTAFVDDELNAVLGVDGMGEASLAVLALGVGSRANATPARKTASHTLSRAQLGFRYPMAEDAHAAGKLRDHDAVAAWRVKPAAAEPRLDRDSLLRAIQRRTSLRTYADTPLSRDELSDLLAWSEAAIPADAPTTVRQVVTVAAVESLAPGVYDAELNLLSGREERRLRERVGFAAMEQDHPRDAAVNVFQVAHVEGVVERLGDRGYRWAQLEAGIRAGRLQVGAFMHGWGAAASTFFDDEVSALLETDESPLLMVSVGSRR